MLGDKHAKKLSNRDNGCNRHNPLYPNRHDLEGKFIREYFAVPCVPDWARALRDAGSQASKRGGDSGGRGSREAREGALGSLCFSFRGLGSTVLGPVQTCSLWIIVHTYARGPGCDNNYPPPCSFANSVPVLPVFLRAPPGSDAGGGGTVRNSPRLCN